MSRVLVVDDDAGVSMVLAGLIRQSGHEVQVVDAADKALQVVARAPVEVVLTDLRMPGMDGLALLRELKRQAPELPIIMLTAHGSIEVAVEAMRAGAADFLTKPFKREEVLFSLDKALRGSERLAAHPPRLQASSPLTGTSPAMLEVTDLIARAARTSAHVLIRGESGTGKELAARSIHAQGKRSTGPFVAVNCAALPDQLLESELFGYEKGAFTGAVQRKPGRVELADGGTLLLDEIGEVSTAVQAKLLRLLQQKEYEPLGATTTKKADTRFLAATHKDLEAMLESGEFREDLYYRLNVVPIWMPPLRDHPEDIPLLATELCRGLAADNDRAGLQLSAEAIDALRRQSWPGNVRELQNFIERLVVFCDSGTIEAADVSRELARTRRPRPPALSSSSGSSSSGAPDSEPSSGGLSERRNDAEREAITEALGRAGGNRTKAARLLGISRRTLYKRLNSLEMLDE